MDSPSTTSGRDQGNGSGVVSLVPDFQTPWTIARQAPLSIENSLSKNTGVDCHSFLQGIFPTQGSKLGLPRFRQILYCLSHSGRRTENQRSYTIAPSAEHRWRLGEQTSPMASGVHHDLITMSNYPEGFEYCLRIFFSQELLWDEKLAI